MPLDPEKRRARARAYRERRKVAKYGPESLGVNMSGRHGNHVCGERNAAWKGGRFVTSQGYIAVRVAPDHPHAWGASPTCRYAYEHILIAEQKIGRPLRDDELVHHDNEDKADNSSDNLVVTTVSDHAREHSDRRGRDALGRFPPADASVLPWESQQARSAA